MVAMLLHPPLQDAIRDPETALDFAYSHAVLDHKADGLSLEVRVVLPMTVHKHTSLSLEGSWCVR